MRNFDRFGSPAQAFLTWADEVYGIDNPRERYELEEDDDDEVVDFLRTEVFRSDQLADFIDWLWEEVKNGEEKGTK